jgi:phenylacetate-CoA ligase
MGLVTDTKRLLENLPPDLRRALESAGSWLPRQLIYGSTFRSTRAHLIRSQWRSAEEHRAYQSGKLRQLVHYVYETVPYYRRVMDERGLRPEAFESLDDLRRLPFVDKATVRENLDEMVSSAVEESRRDLVSTGGTSGEPLKLWLGRGRSSVEWAFMTMQWSRIGYKLGDRRAILRGWAPPNAEKSLSEIHPLLDEVVLSTFHLTREQFPRYVDLIRRFGARFLQAYPSSAEMLCRYLRDAPDAEPLPLRGVLLSSESLYPDQRRLIEETTGARVFSYYGQSEKVLMGGECEESSDYHFFPDYGILEVVDQDGEPVGAGERGQIVGTSLVNWTTPLLRYRTDDLGTVADSPCSCGRHYPRLTEIEGRWHQEWIVGRQGQYFSITALNSHSLTFDTVERFQVRQERPGEAELLVVAGPGFTDRTADECAREYQERTGGEVEFRGRVVEDIPLTQRGKFKFVDQRLSIGREAIYQQDETDTQTRDTDGAPA